MTRLQIFLLVTVMISAGAVITVRHENRLSFVELQKQEQHHDALQAEWGRLMLEKATWTGQHNVADAALKSLSMTVPSPEKIITLDLNQEQRRKSDAGANNE